MTKDELKQEAEEKYHNHKIVDFQGFYNHHYYYLGYVESAEPREKRIAELEEKISVLLSCKKCPENKGGFICQKEYEDKCLAQKIQYITELKEEIKNLEKTYRKQRNKRIDELQKENAELKQENKVLAQNLEDTEILNKTYEKRFKDLEKENAELKDKLEILISVGNVATNGLNDQLTKAKEIISEYVRLANLEKEDTVAIWQLYHKAEQFLKDCEVEK